MVTREASIAGGAANKHFLTSSFGVFVLSVLLCDPGPVAGAPTWSLAGSAWISGGTIHTTNTFDLEISHDAWLASSRLSGSPVASPLRFDGTNIYGFVSGMHGKGNFGPAKGDFDGVGTIYPFAYPIGGLGFQQALWFGLICQIQPSFEPPKVPNLFLAQGSPARVEDYAAVVKGPGFPNAGSKAELLESRLRVKRFVRERFSVQRATNVLGVTVPLEFTRSIYNASSDERSPVISITVVVTNVEALDRPVRDIPITGTANIVDFRFGYAPAPQVQYLTSRWMTTNEMLSDTNFLRLILHPQGVSVPAPSWRGHHPLLLAGWLAVVATALFFLLRVRRDRQQPNVRGRL